MFENKIIFEAENEFYFNNSLKPEPAVKDIPSWWKNIPRSAGIDDEAANAVTVKACAPTLDIFASGYIIKTWTDLYVNFNKDGKQEVLWNVPENVGEREADVLIPWHVNQVSNFEIPDGFSSTVLKYRHGWIIKTPPGWSCLFIHPAGYQNLPLRSIPGLVDTDILKTDINCPFVIKNNFEGLIPKGTPVSQIIPIKRESWKAIYKLNDFEEYLDESAKIQLVKYGYYSSKRGRKIYK